MAVLAKGDVVLEGALLEVLLANLAQAALLGGDQVARVFDFGVFLTQQGADRHLQRHGDLVERGQADIG